jgi:hypothetical protein
VLAKPHVKSSRLNDVVSRALRSPGQSLDNETQEEFAARFGHDFSRVRVHTGSNEARELSAHAFTHGQHIFFAPDRWNPDSAWGRDLLAHELIHTIQHGHDGVTPTAFRLSRPDDHLEIEADAASKGNFPPALISRSSGLAAGVISRRVEEQTVVEPEGKEEVLDEQTELILRRLQTDPDDKSGRVRRLLDRMAVETRMEVLDRVRERLSSAQRDRLAAVLEEATPVETGGDTSTAPVPELSKPDAELAVTEEAHTPVEQPKADATKEGKPQAAAVSGPEDAFKTSEEGTPKTPKVQNQKAEQAAAAKGPDAPKVTEPMRTAAAGGAGVAAASESSSMAEPAADTTAGAAPGAMATEQTAPGTAAPVTEGETPAAAPTEAAAETPTAEAAAAETGAVETPTAETLAVAAETPTAEASAPEATTTKTEAAETAEDETPAVAAESAAGPEGGETAQSSEAEPAEIAALPEPANEPTEQQPDMTLPPETPEAATPSAAGGTLAAAEGSPEPAATSQPEAVPTPAMSGGAAEAAEGSPGAAATSQPENVTTPPMSGGAPEAVTSGAASAPSEHETPESDVSPSGVETPQEAAAAQEIQAPPPTAGAAEAQPPEAASGAPDAAPGGCAPSPEDSAKPGAGEGGEGGGGGGCGGGGGGGAVTEQPAPAQPNVSNADPAAAMGAVANLPPAQLQASLGGVSSAAATAVAKQKQELAANPPQIERPSGVPAQRDASVAVLPPGVPAPKDPKAVERAPAGEAIPVAKPAPLPPPPPSPTQALAGPKLPGEAPLTEADSAKVQAAIRNLPTADPALNVTAGNPPKLALAGDADPKRADEQRAKVDESTDAARAQGLQDVAQPMGENDIYPTVPKETLTANPEGEGGPGVLGTLAACAEGGSKGLAKAQASAGAGGSAGGANAEDETASIVAKEQKGDEIKSAVGKAQGEMVAKQEDNATKIAEEKSKSQKEVDKEIQENAADQKGERTKAREESLKLRTEWNTEQQTMTGDARKDAIKETDSARKQIDDKQVDANKEAAKQIDKGNTEAAAARKESEEKAQAEKRKAEKESSGFLGWVSSKATSFFNGLKSVLGDIFAVARKLVKVAIETATKVATGVIETARKAVVGVIHLAGDALVAVGDRVLAGFPKTREKFRKGVQDRVKAAEETVNKLADKLKKGVQKLLDLLGKVINGYLGLLECAYMAAVDVVAGVVKGAIEFAKNVVKGFAAFAELIKDVAAAPVQWLSNLGKAVVDGLKNCFWSAFKKAVKEWFNSKVEEVLGLPIAIFKLLFKGCIKMKEIGKMAWEALKAAIPMVLVQLLIEKLVAMIVPAAGAILTIIEGLRAAWGTVSRIIAAFALFFIFLKAVKTGNAAGPFATALAAAGIVVIDFVANWLLIRLQKPAGAIAGRLKAMAQKIAKALKKGFAVLKKGAKVAAGAIKRGVVAIGRGIKRGAQAVGRGIKRGAQAVGGGLKKVGTAIAKSKVGKAISRAGKAIAHSKVGKAFVKAVSAVKKLYGRGKAAYQRGKEKIKNWWQKRKQEKQKREEARQQRAFKAAREAFSKRLQRGASLLSIRALAFWLKLRHHFRVMKVTGGEETVTVTAGFSPEEPVVVATLEDLEELKRKASDTAKCKEGVAEVTYVRLLTQENVTLRELMDDAQQQRDLRLIISRGLLDLVRKVPPGVQQTGPANIDLPSLRSIAQAARTVAQETANRVLDQKLTVIEGTKKVRKLYRDVYRRNFPHAIGQIHHLIPLSLGGGNQFDNLLALNEDLHKRIHRLFNEVAVKESGLSLNYQRLRARFGKSDKWVIAVICNDGSIEFSERHFVKTA